MIFLRLFLGFLVQTVPFAVLGLYTFRDALRFSTRKTSLLTTILLLLLSSLFSLTGDLLHNRLPHDSTLFRSVNLVFLLCVLGCFFYFSYVLLLPLEKKLFLFSFMLTSALALTSVCNAITTWIYRDIPFDGLPYEKYSLIVIFFFNAALFPVLLALLKRGYLLIADSLTKKENRYLATLSLLLFLLLASGLSFIDYSNLYNPMSLFLYAALLVTVFVIYAIYFQLMALSHRSMVAQQNSLMLQHQLDIQAEQYRNFQENFKHTRRMRHDLKHHMLLLRGYLEDDQISRAKDYINARIQDVEDYEVTQFCNIPMINWIVSYYDALAQEKDVPFSVQISLSESLSPVAADADLTVILGNLLDNAIREACEAPDERRWIRLHMICPHNMLAITVDNGFSGQRRQEGDRYLSTRQHHTGVGLYTISTIAEKYDGGTEFTDDAGIFHSSVMLRICR